MKNLKHQVLFVLSLFLISINLFLPAECVAFAATLQDFQMQESNQLLRVAFEPSQYNNEVNVYLYTSSSNPVVKERKPEDKSYTIELLDTLIATTNNINLQKVSNLVSGVKIVPFINTNSPKQTGMTRVIIDTKVPGVKFNVIVKSINLPGQSLDKVSSKIYYPPKDEVNQPQNMALFTPLDEKTIAQLPPEDANKKFLAQNPSTIPEVPTSESERLRISPPAGTTPPLIDNSTVQNLPDVSTPATAGANTTTPAQEGEAPQPEPNIPAGGVDTVLPPQLSKWLTVGCGFVIALLLTVAYIVVREMGKQRKSSKKKAGASLPPPVVGFGEELEGMEPVDEVKIRELPESSSSNVQEDRVMTSAPFGEEVEEVNLIDSYDISNNKSIYLVDVTENIALIGLVNEEVIVLNTFQPHEIDPRNVRINISKEGTIVGKDIYHLKIGKWEAVLSSEGDHLSIHSNLTV